MQDPAVKIFLAIVFVIAGGLTIISPCFLIAFVVARLFDSIALGYAVGISLTVSFGMSFIPVLLKVFDNVIEGKTPPRSF